MARGSYPRGVLPPRPPARSGRPLATAALSALAALALLTGCGAAQDAVTSATDDAKQQATRKAQELAVQALTSQVCELTKDGRLSSDDVRTLTSQLDAAAAAGVPAQLLDAVRPVVEQGAGAGKAQITSLRASVCS